MPYMITGISPEGAVSFRSKTPAEAHQTVLLMASDATPGVADIDFPKPVRFNFLGRRVKIITVFFPKRPYSWSEDSIQNGGWDHACSFGLRHYHHSCCFSWRLLSSPGSCHRSANAGPATQIA
jgi:hypothetical protein